MADHTRPASLSRTAAGSRVVTKEGWLMKTGNGSLTKTIYKKRWCILYGGSFSYMKRKEDSEPKGHIFLNHKSTIGRTNDKRHPFTFEIRPAPGDRIYRMQALDEDDRDEWLRELTLVRGINRFDLGGVPDADLDSLPHFNSAPFADTSVGKSRGRTESAFENQRHNRSLSEGGADVPLEKESLLSSLHRITLSSPSKSLEVKSSRTEGKSPKGNASAATTPTSNGCESGHRFQDGGAVIFCSMCGEQRNKIISPSENRAAIPESTHFSRLAELGTFTFSSKEAVGFEIPPGVPGTAREVLICYFLLCGLEFEKDGPSRIFRVRLWTTGGHVMWKLGARYPQTTLSFDSDNIWFPLGATERRLFVQCDDVQTVNCRAIELFVAGYR